MNNYLFLFLLLHISFRDDKVPKMSLAFEPPDEIYDGPQFLGEFSHEASPRVKLPSDK